MKCTATAKNSGVTCKNEAIPGGTVCRMHGGAAPQVRNAAIKRLHDAVPTAIANLIEKQKSQIESVSLRATQDILDRNSIKGENIIRIMMGDAAAAQQGMSDEQADRLRGLPPDELAQFLRTISYIRTGVRTDPKQLVDGLRGAGPADAKA